MKQNIYIFLQINLTQHSTQKHDQGKLFRVKLQYSFVRIQNVIAIEVVSGLHTIESIDGRA